MDTPLAEVVHQLGEPKVLVVGDLMLDRYVYGDADRVSPEAPVLVLRADRREERLGGAAGVAAMLAVLGARVSLTGVVGADLPGRRCLSLLDEVQIDRSLVREDGNRPTSLKERYIGRAQHRHPQQILRVDYEVRTEINNTLAEDLAGALADRLPDYDVVLISDYDKGVCGPLLARGLLSKCRHQGVRALVDPCFGDGYATRYRGCSLLKPNRRAAERATGLAITSLDRAYEAAERLRQELDAEVGLVTLDRDGMVLVEPDGNRRHFPVRTRQVYDITAAGDMALAVLGLVVAAGFGYPEAVALANVAAGLEVERFGTTPLSRAEILAELLTAGRPTAKLIMRPELARTVETLRRAGRTIVFTNGCFDLLHAGHVHCLRQAKAQGDLLIVGLNTDASVRRLGKGPGRPVHLESYRAELLGALECVDHVCLFDEETPVELIRLLRPDVLVKGADYGLEQVVGADIVQSYGGRVHLVPLIPGQSTTATLGKLRGQDGPTGADAS